MKGGIKVAILTQIIGGKAKIMTMYEGKLN